jgi:ammonia channel protein AmtB
LEYKIEIISCCLSEIDRNNSGLYSTFGVTGNKWRLAAKSTCTTMAASFAGGLVAIVMSYYTTGGKVEVLATINGVLGALVGITASMIVMV